MGSYVIELTQLGQFDIITYSQVDFFFISYHPTKKVKFCSKQILKNDHLLHCSICFFIVMTTFFISWIFFYT